MIHFFKEDYSKYTVVDFSMNDDFKLWVKSPDVESDMYWQSVQESYPDKVSAIKRAVKLVKLLNAQQLVEHNTGKDKVWQAIQKEITAPQLEGVIKQHPLWKRYLRIAAIFILSFALGGSVLYWNYTQPLEFKSKYGEVKTIVLPDQSIVKLNGNSSIKYAKHWNNDAIREISLEGEAYFNVKHLHKLNNVLIPHDRFIVRSGAINIEVLGTSFNVKNRRNNIDVVLASGKVKVGLKDLPSKVVFMTPGDKVRFDKELNLLTKSSVNAEISSSWKTGKLMLTDASVNDVIEYIEDNYGYKVLLYDKNMGTKKLEGVLLLDNLDDMLFALSTMLDLDIKKHDNILEFNKAKF